MSRANDGVMTAADICRIAHYYFVSVETMTLRLEELRLLPGGTWERLRDRGFRVREAQQQLGLTHRPDGEGMFPMRYQMLAIRGYEEGNLTEGELSRLLRLDRVSARRTVQRMTHTTHLLEGGEVESLPIDLAARLAGQGA